jgi:hypothetical protein
MWLTIQCAMHPSFEVTYVGDQNTIEYIRMMISGYHIRGLSPDSFQLSYRGLVLKDTDTLGKLGICNGDTLNLGLKYRTGY